MRDMAAWFAGAALVLGMETESRAAHVVVMRDGKRTVVTVQADYDGPLDKFELSMPLSATLRKEDVRAVAPDVLERLDRLDAPQLFEQHEVDPCNPRGDAGASVAPDASVEARAGGEYVVSVVGKNIVARLDPKKVRTVKRGERTIAQLSPLRFHFDDDEFRVPLRVGNDRDIVLHVLARKRQEVSNRTTLPVPTNLELAPAALGSFSSFYATLFDRTLASSPDAAVLEFVSLQNAPISVDDLVALGDDVMASVTSETDSMDPTILAALGADGGANTKYHGIGAFVLTRLHFRVAPGVAAPMVMLRDAEGGAFHAKYVTKTSWSGESRCDVPVHGVWIAEPPIPATNLSTAARIPLEGLPLGDIPAIGYTAPADSAPKTAPSASAPGEGEGEPPKRRNGCGSCGTAVLAALYSRRRKKKT